MLILLTILCLIIAPPFIIYRPPGFVISYFQHRWPSVLWRVSTDKKIIALTVDDAPSEYTNQILDVLKENDAHATFFAIGSQIPGRESILENIVQAGNELGNHAMHDEPSRSLSSTELVDQIKLVQASISRAYETVGNDQPPRYFRPGSGFFSSRMQKILDTLQYKLVLGSIYPHDPQIPFPSINAAHILSMLRPGGIIICHDRRGWTVPMLKKVLPEMRRTGYQVVTITELLKEGAVS